MTGPRSRTIESFNHQGFPVTHRIDYAKASPDGFKAFGAVYATLLKGSLPKALIDLVYLRVSLINGCAYCIDMHTRDLLKGGLPVEKLVLVPVWRETGEVFSTRERVALAWTEAVTLVADTGVPDAVYQATLAEFEDKELAELTYAIGLMNAFNRFGVAFRSTPAAAKA
nr:MULTISPECIES: carboxymuconolactone decarboxylase family protein [Ramlibacter]